jgi:hypothetical protein
MKINNKLMIVGISLVVVGVTLSGCATMGNQQPDGLPIFTLLSFNGIWDFHHPNASFIEFDISVVNPSDDDIEVQILVFTILDDHGNVLLSFRPGHEVAVDGAQSTTWVFSLKAHESITVHSSQSVFRDFVSDYCWAFLGTPLHNVSVSGFYQVNGDLQWFESNGCHIDIPVCK